MARISYLALLWLCLAVVPCAFSQRAGQDPDALTAFRKGLEHDGFKVTTGAAFAMNLVEAWCANTPGLVSAWYSNNEPYIQLQVPKSADDPTPVSDFQLRPDEAIVLIGLTPPPIKYFGFYPFLATKGYPRNSDGSRKELRASLGDAINNATVRTTEATPFNSPVALIFTPDQGTDMRIRGALESAGYPEGIINTVVFPASLLKLGYDDTADQVRITMRNGPIWQKQSDGDAYVASPPLTIFRVTPQQDASLNPFPAPRLRVRGTGRTEMDLMNKLGQLRQGIITANSGLHATDIPSTPYFYEGYDYLQRGVDPNGDSRDAFFLTAAWVPEYGSGDSKYKITLAEDEFLMVYGVNHVVTGKATYMSVNVYATAREVNGEIVDEGKLSVGNVNDDEFPGTATGYLPAGDADANRMYAYKVSRSCGKHEPRCVQLSVPKGCNRLPLDSSTVMGLVFRMYLEPTTKVGPAMPEILYDRVMKFSPRSQAP